MSYDREALRRQIKFHEGKRAKPYRDTVGKLTIGVGRNLDDVGLSEDEIDYLLENDIMKVERELSQRLPWIAALDDARQRVLLDMAFNLGIGGLLLFRNTLRHIEAGRYEAAADHMLQSKWATQVGKRARRLADAMKTGRLEI